MTVACFSCQRRVPLIASVRAMNADWCHVCAGRKIEETSSLRSQLSALNDRLMLAERRLAGSHDIDLKADVDSAVEALKEELAKHEDTRRRVPDPRKRIKKDPF